MRLLIATPEADEATLAWLLPWLAAQPQIQARWLGPEALAQGADLRGVDALWVLNPPTGAAGQPYLSLVEQARALDIAVTGTGAAAGATAPYDQRVLGVLGQAQARLSAQWQAQGSSPAQSQAQRQGQAQWQSPAPWQPQAGAPGQWQSKQPTALEPELTYPQARGGRAHRWYRPLAAIFTALAILIVFNVVIAIAMVAVMAVQGGDLLSQLGAGEIPMDDPWMMVLVDLSIIAAIPAAILGVLVAYGRPWKRLLSIEDRMRWGWFARSLLWSVPFWGAYLAAAWIFGGEEAGPRAQHWLALSLIVLTLTPLQCAAEELLFRGVLAQGAGAFFRHAGVAFFASTLVASGLFALAHGSLDPWILLEVGAFAVAAQYLAWRTGGLESAIGLHIVNNVIIMFTGIFTGGLSASFISGETASTWHSALTAIVANTVMALILQAVAVRAGVAPKGIFTPRRLAAPANVSTGSTPGSQLPTSPSPTTPATTE